MDFAEIINSIIDGADFDIDNVEHKALLSQLLSYARAERVIYSKMYEYYNGDTDAIKNYQMITKRANLKTNVNYLKKFIKEEVSYAVGNKLTYNCDNQEMAKTLMYNMQHWDENHDEDLMKYMLIFTKAYEVYYIKGGKYFNSEIMTPLDGYAYCDRNGEPIIFIHEWAERIDTSKTYIDVYTKKYVYHLDANLNECKERYTHRFGEIPVSVGILTKEGVKDSLYNDTKGLQDGIETILSDSVNEISDFRNAYLVFKGCKIDKDGLELAKELGVMQTGEPKSDIGWLIKNINDTFIQNTLDRYVDTLYQITSHVNHNEKLQSNLSSLALRSRLIALENKCTLNVNSHRNVVKKRLRLLCSFLNYSKGLSYDDKEVTVKYTPNIPQDDLMMAQTISQLEAGTISKATARAQFSFINNPAKEKELCEEEMKQEFDLIGDNYMKEPGGSSGGLDE